MAALCSIFLWCQLTYSLCFPLHSTLCTGESIQGLTHFQQVLWITERHPQYLSSFDVFLEGLGEVRLSSPKMKVMDMLYIIENNSRTALHTGISDSGYWVFAEVLPHVPVLCSEPWWEMHDEVQDSGLWVFRNVPVIWLCLKTPRAFPFY